MDETELNEKISEKKEKLKKLYESLGFYKRKYIPKIIGLICLVTVSVPILCRSEKFKRIGIAILVGSIVIIAFLGFMLRRLYRKIENTEEEIRSFEREKRLNFEEKNLTGRE